MKAVRSFDITPRKNRCGFVRVMLPGVSFGLSAGDASFYRAYPVNVQRS